MVSSLSLTVIVPVAAWSGVSTAYTSLTPRCPHIAKRRINVPQDEGSATASMKDRHETQHLIRGGEPGITKLQQLCSIFQTVYLVFINLHRRRNKSFVITVIFKIVCNYSG